MYNDVRIRVEVVVVLSSGDLRDIDVHTAVVAPIFRAGHKDKQVISAVPHRRWDLHGLTFISNNHVTRSASAVDLHKVY